MDEWLSAGCVGIWLLRKAMSRRNIECCESVVEDQRHVFATVRVVWLMCYTKGVLALELQN